jgi:FkbM family methyltransferase
MKKVNNFVKIDSERGPFIINRHCSFQAEHMIKTGQTHIENELNNILGIAKLLPDNCVVVDAGANVGMVAVPMAQSVRSKNGVVHAFEPQRMMAYALCGAVALNDLENVVVHNKALGASTELCSIATPDYSKPQDFGRFQLNQKSSKAIEAIEVISLDSMALPRLDFLKIDVEGMELDVLSGAKNTLSQWEPWSWVEHWQLSVDDIKQCFVGLDYEFYLMDKLNLLCAPKSRLNDVEIVVKAKQV